MEDRGWFRVERRVFDDEWLNDEPATKLSAWLDLIALATHKPITLRLKHGKVALERGQLTASLGFLATRWSWPKARVQRFIAALERRAMVDTATDTGQLVLTIRNYCEYQDAEASRDTAPIRHRYGTDTGPIQNTTTEPQNQENTPPTPRERGEGRRKASPKKARATFPERFEEFWSAYPRKVGKAAAFEAWRKYDHEAQECARLAAPRFAADMAAEERPPDKIPHAATWLNQQRFTDYFEPEYPANAARHEQDDERDDRGAGRGGDAPTGAGEGGGGDGPVSVRPDGDPACRPDVALPDLFRRRPEHAPVSSPAAARFEAGGADVGAECGRRGRALH